MESVNISKLKQTLEKQSHLIFAIFLFAFSALCYIFTKHTTLLCLIVGDRRRV